MEKCLLFAQTCDSSFGGDGVPVKRGNPRRKGLVSVPSKLQQIFVCFLVKSGKEMLKTRHWNDALNEICFASNNETITGPSSENVTTCKKRAVFLYVKKQKPLGSINNFREATTTLIYSLNEQIMLFSLSRFYPITEMVTYSDSWFKYKAWA